MHNVLGFTLTIKVTSLYLLFVVNNFIHFFLEFE